MSSLYLRLAAVCITIFALIRKECLQVQRLGNAFNKLMQQFEAWQMLR